MKYGDFVEFCLIQRLRFLFHGFYEHSFNKIQRFSTYLCFRHNICPNIVEMKPTYFNVDNKHFNPPPAIYPEHLPAVPAHCCSFLPRPLHSLHVSILACPRPFPVNFSLLHSLGALKFILKISGAGQVWDSALLRVPSWALEYQCRPRVAWRLRASCPKQEQKAKVKAIQSG